MSDRATERWNVGVLATPSATFDSGILTEQTSGTLAIGPFARGSRPRFSGYVSTAAFDLRIATISTELRRTATGATTIFAAAIDSANWLGFRIEGGQLSIESHTAGRTTSRKIPYDASRHRFLRLRSSNVANVVVWETSRDGVNWNPEYVETATIPLSSLRIAVSAGTENSAAVPAKAVFEKVVVERKP